MSIKAEFLRGETEKRVSALYQWDYGQTLEIESPDLSSVVEIEVHFACPEMSEAIVHPCSVDNGVATVTIPNRCLEQSHLITAWVYEINGTSGATTKVITIPVVARTRPPMTREIPQDISDKYTELITEVNEAVERITLGDIVVAYAAKATSSDRATQADNASSAAHAITADSATRATSADKTIFRGVLQSTTYMVPENGHIYLFDVNIGGSNYYATMPWIDGDKASVTLGIGAYKNAPYHFMLNRSSQGEISVTGWKLDGTLGGEVVAASIRFAQI